MHLDAQVSKDARETQDHRDSMVQMEMLASQVDKDQRVQLERRGSLETKELKDFLVLQVLRAFVDLLVLRDHRE